ncbi:MAG: hypothetical protein U1E86_27920, partial [Burkholderiaceae bacterium]
NQAAQGAGETGRLAPIARQWERRVRTEFLRAYGEVAVAGGLYADAAAFEAAGPMLELFELQRALYEVRYEVDNRPDWAAVPLESLAALMPA